MRKSIITFCLVNMVLVSWGKPHTGNKARKKANNIVSVTMHRTTCYGKCPDYIITLNDKGHLVYNAIRFNADSGQFTKEIKRTKATALLTRFETYRVDTCKELYDNMLPDLPGLIFAVQYKDHTQTIHDAHCGPAFLKKLSVAMDALVGKKVDGTWKSLK